MQSIASIISLYVHRVPVHGFLGHCWDIFPISEATEATTDSEAMFNRLLLPHIDSLPSPLSFIYTYIVYVWISNFLSRFY